MPGRDSFVVEGRVTALLKEALVQVELSNGHQLVAHFARHARERGLRLALGERVRVDVSPFDLSRGRIVLEKADNESSCLS